MSCFSSPTRSPFGLQKVRRGLTGRGASAGFSCALVVATFALAACGDDEKNPSPAQPTAVAEAPDASVRVLPGDGLEITPESDIDRRQLNPIGPEGVTEGIDEFQNGPRRRSDAGAPAATPDPSDAGNGTN